MAYKTKWLRFNINHEILQFQFSYILTYYKICEAIFAKIENQYSITNIRVLLLYNLSCI